MRKTISRKKAATLAGSYSTATLRIEDLIPAACNALYACGSKRDAKRFFKEWEGIAATGEPKSWGGVELSAEESEKASWLCEEIVDAINWALPQGFYYGCTEGDGADIGIWSTFEDEEG